jgi:MFS family permease
MSQASKDSVASGSRSIHWGLAWGVVALQSALQLGWIVYRSYQPSLLNWYGFAGWLLAFSLLPGILGLIIQPLAGFLSDRLETEGRGRLLPITITVLVAGMIFLTIVGVLKRGLSGGNLLLPALLISWLVAVQWASSPNLALLQISAPLQVLPRVAALGTLVQGVIGAFEPYISSKAIRIGPSLTFVLGAAVLGLGLTILRSVPLPAPSSQDSCQGNTKTRNVVSHVLLLMLIGLCVGLSNSIVLSLLPRLEQQHSDKVVTALLLTSAVIAPWIGQLTCWWGSRRSLNLGIILNFLGVTAALLLPGFLKISVIFILGFSLSLLRTSLTALSLTTLPPDQAGLGAGLVLGSSGASGALLILVGGDEQRLITGFLFTVSAVMAFVGARLLPMVRRNA